MTPGNSGPVVSCDTSALDAEQHARRKQLLDELTSRAQEVTFSTTGVVCTFDYKPELWLAASELISLERRCCPFLGFELKLAAGETLFTLEMTGPEGTDRLLKTELA